MSTLLHRELLESIPLVGTKVADSLEGLAIDASQRPSLNENISVVIRTLNEESQLEQLMQDIHENAQSFGGEVEVVVVDNESTDRTRQVAKSFGANVVTLAREAFSYPHSMNLGMDATSHDLVWLTVGHALPTTTQLLHGGARNFTDENNAGAFYAPIFPNQNASLTERLVGLTAPIALRQPRNVGKAGLGTMAASSAMLRKNIWKELGKFDERYETGGEDTALAAKMLQAGYEIQRDPLLAVHHSHNKGVFGNLAQTKGWLRTLRGPVKLDREELIKSHSHIDFE